MQHGSAWPRGGLAIDTVAYTPADFEAMVTRAKGHRMTPDERAKQRVSMMMGLRSEDSTITRASIEAYLLERGELASTSIGS